MLLEQWRVKPIPGDDHRDLGISTSITVAEAWRLRHLAAAEGWGLRVLEIGSAYGFSTVTMALAGAHVDAVDPHRALGSEEQLRGNLHLFGVAERVTMHLGHIEKVWGRLPAGYDLVFIDGDHGYEAVKRDIGIARRLTIPGAVICCHDYNEDTCPGVKRACDELYPQGPDRLTDTLWEVRS